MYWIIGIIVIIVLYKLLVSFTITKNVTARYFSLKDIFANDESVTIEKYLELSGIFSQIVDVKNGKIPIDEIKESAKRCSEIYENTEVSEIEMLTDFCYEITKLVYIGSGIPYIQASEKAQKEFDKIEKDIEYIKKKGYSNTIYKSTLNFINKYPESMKGNYNF